jgi:hypothetical protein
MQNNASVLNRRALRCDALLEALVTSNRPFKETELFLLVLMLVLHEI